MSQNHFTLSFRLNSPDGPKLLALQLPSLMPELFRANDTIGTVHYSRFTVPGAVQGVGLVGAPHRRPRSRGDRSVDRASETSDRPSLIACRTVIGFGAPNRQGTEKAHGAPLGADEVAKTRAALGWPHQPFQIPEPVIEQWRQIGARGQGARRAWIERTRRLNSAGRSLFTMR